MFDFGISLSSTLDSYRLGATVRVLGNFHSLFSFLRFLSFFWCLSLGGTFSYGAPVHSPSMPLSRYATENR